MPKGAIKFPTAYARETSGVSEAPATRNSKTGMRHVVQAMAASVLVGVVAHTQAQDLEPRAYSNSPTGLNFVLVGFGHTTGSVLTDPALPVENVSIESALGI